MVSRWTELGGHSPRKSWKIILRCQMKCELVLHSFCLFLRDGVLLCCLGWTQTSSFKCSPCFSLLSSWDYRCTPHQQVFWPWSIARNLFSLWPSIHIHIHTKWNTGPQNSAKTYHMRCTSICSMLFYSIPPHSTLKIPWLGPIQFVSWIMNHSLK